MIDKEKAVRSMQMFENLIRGQDLDPDVTCGDVVEATKMAIEVLQRQIDYGDQESYREAKLPIKCYYKETTFNCPTCRKRLCYVEDGIKPNCCPHCGQVIDWRGFEHYNVYYTFNALLSKIQEDLKSCKYLKENDVDKIMYSISKALVDIDINREWSDDDE